MSLVDPKIKQQQKLERMEAQLARLSQQIDAQKHKLEEPDGDTEENNPLLSRNITHDNEEEEKLPSSHSQNRPPENIFSKAVPIGGSHCGFKQQPNIIGNLQDMDPDAHDRMSHGSVILGERNMNAPILTKTPSQYGMKQRVQRRHRTNAQAVHDAMMSAGVGAARQLEMHDENEEYE